MSSKPILYRTSLDWTESHQGVIRSPKKTDVAVTCPPPFCDVDTLWSPEEFFVGSIEMCLMMTFIWMAERGKLEFLAYSSRAEGRVEILDGKARFTKVDVYPRIETADAAAAKKTERLLRAAEKNCLIGNSITTEVEVHAEIVARGG
ncbi:MAG: OsmC-like protein [candidate division BRC1 bacterium ADurb.BinA364]|nr:MAG: OsmC-like protein [candidate division BRC1 bacterium ADurb.BinA364]